MNNYLWKCRHFQNVLCHSVKVKWSSWIMNVNHWDIALIILVTVWQLRRYLPSTVHSRWRMRLSYAPLPQRPVAGRKLVGKRVFHFRPISSDIGRTHFNLSRKDGAGTLLAGVWSGQPIGDLIVARHWWDTGRIFSPELHRSSWE